VHLEVRIPPQRVDRDDHASVAKSEPRFGALRAAVPEAVCGAWSAFVWRTTPGELLRDRFAKPDASALAAAVGDALAQMQASEVPWREAYAARDEIAPIDRWVSLAARAWPERAESLQRLRERHAAGAAQASEATLVPAHRDFHDGQILAAEGDLTLLDFDTACRAPAELDLGNFRAHLRLREIEGLDGDWTRIADDFLAGHREAPAAPPVASARLRWYEAGAFLRLACVYAFRPGPPDLSDRLLAEAHARIETNAPSTGALR